MPKTVFVVDGLGGGIGAQIVARIRKEIKADIDLFALATNAFAAQRMVDAERPVARRAKTPSASRSPKPTLSSVLWESSCPTR